MEYNNIITLFLIRINKKKYRAGYILTNKNNVTIIEYSDDSPGDTRLFYSLKENGRGFYFNDAVTKEISLSSDQYYNNEKIIGRYECINDFVYLKDDTNREKQYLFSISSYLSLTELHDIEAGSYTQWVTTDFLGISDKHRYIFSYRFSFFEWKNTNVYFCVYVQYEGTNEKHEDFSVSYSISRFQFEKDNNNNIKVSGLTSIEDRTMYDNRIVSAFMVEKYEIFVVSFVKLSNTKLTIKFYDYNLNSINDIEFDTISNPLPGFGAFFKGVHCQYEYAGFMYYTNGDDGTSLVLKFIYINNKNHENKYTVSEKFYQNINDHDFETYTLLNDFYKISPDRFIFISTTGYNKLYIYLSIC